jgi:hypothetical protein
MRICILYVKYGPKPCRKLDQTEVKYADHNALLLRLKRQFVVK